MASPLLLPEALVVELLRSQLPCLVPLSAAVVARLASGLERCGVPQDRGLVAMRGTAMRSSGVFAKMVCARVVDDGGAVLEGEAVLLRCPSSAGDTGVRLVAWWTCGNANDGARARPPPRRCGPPPPCKRQWRWRRARARLSRTGTRDTSATREGRARAPSWKGGPRRAQPICTSQASTVVAGTRPMRSMAPLHLE
ncbi:hypothetical protein STCU_12389 [Strigomonas culicis]|uniref:Uncharacterized protein n=1 Tax=Strigomonas culicis TaxID=28005 RepID=S9UK04_9TRYP|nr:hypothetical protein STCU_12389 [Strigomonas culicis]|eukprot:EPY15016.1 hypothetical protein STCU_12389 [Strigomonas culicis]